ncbi:hypothetical protein DPMN_139508 [Dreissena polymorpha]|uniref:Uncharacterized protein n=1 Tax=Dreissena polymorpha TaxID=45954 RepID=A0A9D4G5V2_DREPO|nr:hypothetical protein DPMN_139508 [Dreissena polymorpha]
MSLSNVKCASYASKILYTFKNLTKLHLRGTFSGRFTLQLPETLQCISLQKVECSAEWLCSLLIALSSLHHSVRCELWDILLQPCAEDYGDDSQTHIYDSDLKYCHVTCPIFKLLLNMEVLNGLS